MSLGPTTAWCAGRAPDPVCPSSALVDFLGRRHMVHILRLFAGRPVLRFGEIRAATEGPSNVVAARLRELVGDGLLARTEAPRGPLRVEYTVTNKGAALVAALGDLDRFVEAHGALGRERVKARGRRAPP